MGRMYENVKTWNPFVGCRFHCVYCVPSFQRQAKRRKKWCELCYNYEPHFHPERLGRIPNSKAVFTCAYGDVSFADVIDISKVFDVIKLHKDKDFYIQSKNPKTFLKWFEIFRRAKFEIPKNIVFGTTIETSKDAAVGYRRISKAPFNYNRYYDLAKLDWPRKYVTIEPIMSFDVVIMVKWIRDIKPEFVYLGYDNHDCRLPEPSLEETQELIEELRKFTEVRLKTIREAWWEQKEVR